MALTSGSKILVSDVSGAVKGFSVSGKTVTFTKLDGTTGTFTTQDTNTTYSAATSSALGLVKVGSNITNSSGTISISKENVTSALGYTPPTSAGITTVKGQIGSAWAANSTSMTLPSGGTWFVWFCGFNSSSAWNRTGGVSTSSGTSSNGFTNFGNTYSGGTKVYGKYKEAGENKDSYGESGKLAAIRIA